jgi:glutathione S-transferase
MPEIVLYQFGPDLGVESGSPFCVKVHRGLALKGLDYRPRIVGSPGEMKRLNPGVSKVPVLEWDGEFVTDSRPPDIEREERVT